MTSPEFERGVRAGVEAHDLYFRDENDGAISGHFDDAELEKFKDGAIRDALNSI